MKNIKTELIGILSQRESFIEKYKDRVDWYNISRCQKLSEEFLERHKDKVNWPLIFIYQDLSEDFKKKYEKYTKK